MRKQLQTVILQEEGVQSVSVIAFFSHAVSAPCIPMKFGCSNDLKRFKAFELENNPYYS